MFGSIEHLDFSLGHLIIKHLFDIADVFYSLSIHHWYYEDTYWVRWTYDTFIKHKPELQFVLNHLGIQKTILVVFK